MIRFCLPHKAAPYRKKLSPSLRRDGLCLSPCHPRGREKAPPELSRQVQVSGHSTQNFPIEPLQADSYAPWQISRLNDSRIEAGYISLQQLFNLFGPCPNRSKQFSPKAAGWPVVSFDTGTRLCKAGNPRTIRASRSASAPSSLPRRNAVPRVRFHSSSPRRTAYGRRGRWEHRSQ